MKYNKNGGLANYKTRIVVKGCTRRPGCETFAPVVRLGTVRDILALAVSENPDCYPRNGAYLNVILKEMVYMRPRGL